MTPCGGPAVVAAAAAVDYYYHPTAICKHGNMMWVVVVEIMENYANAADISPRDKTWMASFGGTEQQQKLKAPAEHERPTNRESEDNLGICSSFQLSPLGLTSWFQLFATKISAADGNFHTHVL